MQGKPFKYSSNKKKTDTEYEKNLKLNIRQLEILVQKLPQVKISINLGNIISNMCDTICEKHSF